MADNVSVKIDEQVKGNRVIVYMKGKKNFPQCGFSAHTVEILQSSVIRLRPWTCWKIRPSERGSSNFRTGLLFRRFS